jgi:hypothetical protein
MWQALPGDQAQVYVSAAIAAMTDPPPRRRRPVPRPVESSPEEPPILELTEPGPVHPPIIFGITVRGGLGVAAARASEIWRSTHL